MTIHQPDNDPQHQPSFPRIVFNSPTMRYVELHTEYSKDSSWYAAFQRLEAAYHSDGDISLCQMHSEEAPVKLFLHAQTLHRLIIGYLDYLADRGIVIAGSIAEHPLVQAFTRYIQFCEVEQTFRPPIERTHNDQDDDFLENDDLSDLDEHPF